MQVQSDVYTSRYHIASNQGEIDFDESIYNLQGYGILPLNEYWALDNCYCGFDPSIHNYTDVSVCTTTYLSYDPENTTNIISERVADNERINYRIFLAGLESTSINDYVSTLQYTNISQSLEPMLTGNYETRAFSYYDIRFNYTQSAYLDSAPYHRFYPVTKIDINKIVLMPRFVFRKISFNESMTPSLGTPYSYTWAEIKPEDKTPAGEFYDFDFWDKGFKDEISGGRVISRTICTGCIVTPYFGDGTINRATMAFADTQDNGWNVDDNRVIPSGNKSRYLTLKIVAEKYDKKNNSIYYSGLPGLTFSNRPAYNLSGNWWMPNYLAYNGNPSLMYGMGYGTIPISATNSNNLPQNTALAYSLDDLDSTYTDRLSGDVYLPIQYSLGEGANITELLNDGCIMHYTGASSSTNRVFNPTYGGVCYSIKKLWRTLASLGMFVCADNTTAYTATTDPVTTSNLYKGNVDENNITDGVMVQGDDINNLPDIDANQYDPVIPSPGGDDDDEESGDKIPNQTRGFTGAANFITQYALTGQQVATFGAGLWTSWTTGDGLWTDMWKNFKLLWNNETFNGSLDISTAIDFIVSLRLFPFDLSKFIGTSENSIKMGTGAFPIEVSNVWKLLSTVVYVDCGTVTVPRVFNDFRDYENMNITAYLPYCGTVELNPGDVIGRTLRCMYAVDLQSGQCLAVIEDNYNGEMLYNIASISGSMGAVIPVTATNAGQITAQKINDAVGVAGLLGGMFMQNITRGGNSFNGELISSVSRYGYGMINDNLSGALAGISGAVDRFNRGAVSCPSLSGGTGIASFFSADTPFIQMRYGIYSNPTNYKHSVGQVNTSSDTLSSFSGYTVCENPDVSSLSCTDDEKALIRSALQSGVYV